MAVFALFDANVLYSSRLRDLFIRLHIAGVVRAHWTNAILDECFGNLKANRLDLDPNRLDRTRELMNKAIRGDLVVDYEKHIPHLTLPDPNDRHVLAAAIACEANTIVTFNLSDFPANSLVPHGIKAQHPDHFLVGLLKANTVRVLQTLMTAQKSLKNPPVTVLELLKRYRRSGLEVFANHLEQLHLAGTW